MKRNEVEKLIDDTVQKLYNTHLGLIAEIDLIEFKAHALTLAFQESKFNEKAKNKNSTAKGLFQILDGTRRDIEKRIMKINDKSPYDDIWKPEYNAYLGMGYLAYQYKRYGKNWNKAIIAYNLGSWKDQKTTAYLNTHNNYFSELYPSGLDYSAKPSDSGIREINFKFGFK